MNRKLYWLRLQAKAVLSSGPVHIVLKSVLAVVVLLARVQYVGAIEEISVPIVAELLLLVLLSSLIVETLPKPKYSYEAGIYGVYTPSLKKVNGFVVADGVSIGESIIRIRFREPMRCVPTITLLNTKPEIDDVLNKMSLKEWSEIGFTIDFSESKKRIESFSYEADARVFKGESLLGKLLKV